MAIQHLLPNPVPLSSSPETHTTSTNFHLGRLPLELLMLRSLLLSSVCLPCVKVGYHQNSFEKSRLVLLLGDSAQQVQRVRLKIPVCKPGFSILIFVEILVCSNIWQPWLINSTLHQVHLLDERCRSCIKNTFATSLELYVYLIWGMLLLTAQKLCFFHLEVNEWLQHICLGLSCMCLRFLWFDLLTYCVLRARHFRIIVWLDKKSI